jgi:hypothetical protein
MYRCGLLADIPTGVRAPTCHGEIERPDGSVWLWLEDITDVSEATWSVDTYPKVARHLGRFNDAYLAGCPLPETPALSRRWLWQTLGAAALSIAELRASGNRLKD